MTKHFYMACLDVTGRRCLVVGGGSVGAEKAAGLVACGARVTVVSPELDESLAELGVEWRRGRYRRRDLRGAFLVIAATSDRAVNERVHRDAEARGMLCNVADVPDLCNFILPAVHREGPIAIAVSTGGASPALAKRLRDDLGARIDEEHVDLAYRLRDLRPWVRNHYHSYRERKEFFETVVEDTLG